MLCRMSEAETRRDIGNSVSLLGASSPAPSQGAAAATIQARLTAEIMCVKLIFLIKALIFTL